MYVPGRRIARCFRGRRRSRPWRRRSRTASPTRRARCSSCRRLAARRTAASPLRRHPPDQCSYLVLCCRTSSGPTFTSYPYPTFLQTVSNLKAQEGFKATRNAAPRFRRIFGLSEAGIPRRKPTPFPPSPRAMHTDVTDRASDGGARRRLMSRSRSRWAWPLPNQSAGFEYSAKGLL